jgi:hypothetical protein
MRSRFFVGFERGSLSFVPNLKVAACFLEITAGIDSGLDSFMVQWTGCDVCPSSR